MDDFYRSVGFIVVNVILMGVIPLVVIGIPIAIILRIKRGYWGDSPRAILNHIQKESEKRRRQKQSPPPN